MPNLPDAVRRMAECAPGKAVRVVTTEGAFAIGGGESNEPEVPALSIKALQREQAQDREAIAQLKAAVANLEATIAAWESALAKVGNMQASLGASMTKMVEVMELPVKPIYDAAGRLIGARRVAKL